jgi:hypothetical protein
MTTSTASTLNSEQVSAAREKRKQAKKKVKVKATEARKAAKAEYTNKLDLEAACMDIMT